jgi:hypothetical protein
VRETKMATRNSLKIDIMNSEGLYRINKHGYSYQGEECDEDYGFSV